jgi:hypothetical protein
MPDETYALLGAPRCIEWRLREGAEGLELALVLRNKPASRLPEFGLVEVTPEGAGSWKLLKTGLWIEPAHTARRGGGALHAIFAAHTRIGGRDLTITPLDTALAGATGTDPMRFAPEPPDYTRGLDLHLYNNKWGTNFPMWWEGDLVARFVLGA